MQFSKRTSRMNSAMNQLVEDNYSNSLQGNADVNTTGYVRHRVQVIESSQNRGKVSKRYEFNIWGKSKADISTHLLTKIESYQDTKTGIVSKVVKPNCISDKSSLSTSRYIFKFHKDKTKGGYNRSNWKEKSNSNLNKSAKFQVFENNPLAKAKHANVDDVMCLARKMTFEVENDVKSPINSTINTSINSSVNSNNNNNNTNNNNNNHYHFNASNDTEPLTPSEPPGSNFTPRARRDSDVSWFPHSPIINSAPAAHSWSQPHSHSPSSHHLFLSAPPTSIVTHSDGNTITPRPTLGSKFSLTLNLNQQSPSNLNQLKSEALTKSPSPLSRSRSRFADLLSFGFSRSPSHRDHSNDTPHHDQNLQDLNVAISDTVPLQSVSTSQKPSPSSSRPPSINRLTFAGVSTRPRSERDRDSSHGRDSTSSTTAPHSAPTTPGGSKLLPRFSFSNNNTNTSVLVDLSKPAASPGSSSNRSSPSLLQRGSFSMLLSRNSQKQEHISNISPSHCVPINPVEASFSFESLSPLRQASVQATTNDVDSLVELLDSHIQTDFYRSVFLKQLTGVVRQNDPSIDDRSDLSNEIQSVMEVETTYEARVLPQSKTSQKSQIDEVVQSKKSELHTKLSVSATLTHSHNNNLLQQLRLDLLQEVQDLDAALAHLGQLQLSSRAQSQRSMSQKSRSNSHQSTRQLHRTQSLSGATKHSRIESNKYTQFPAPFSTSLILSRSIDSALHKSTLKQFVPKSPRSDYLGSADSCSDSSHNSSHGCNGFNCCSSHHANPASRLTRINTGINKTKLSRSSKSDKFIPLRISNLMPPSPSTAPTTHDTSAVDSPLSHSILSPSNVSTAKLPTTTNRAHRRKSANSNFSSNSKSSQFKSYITADIYNVNASITSNSVNRTLRLSANSSRQTYKSHIQIHSPRSSPSGQQDDSEERLGRLTSIERPPLPLGAMRRSSHYSTASAVRTSHTSRSGNSPRKSGSASIKISRGVNGSIHLSRNNATLKEQRMARFRARAQVEKDRKELQRRMVDNRAQESHSAIVSRSIDPMEVEMLLNANENNRDSVVNAVSNQYNEDYMPSFCERNQTTRVTGTGTGTGAKKGVKRNKDRVLPSQASHRSLMSFRSITSQRGSVTNDSSVMNRLSLNSRTVNGNRSLIGKFDDEDGTETDGAAAPAYHYSNKSSESRVHSGSTSSMGRLSVWAENAISALHMHPSRISSPRHDRDRSLDRPQLFSPYVAMQSHEYNSLGESNSSDSGNGSVAEGSRSSLAKSASKFLGMPQNSSKDQSNTAPDKETLLERFTRNKSGKARSKQNGTTISKLSLFNFPSSFRRKLIDEQTSLSDKAISPREVKFETESNKKSTLVAFLKAALRFKRNKNPRTARPYMTSSEKRLRELRVGSIRVNKDELTALRRSSGFESVGGSKKDQHQHSSKHLQRFNSLEIMSVTQADFDNTDLRIKSCSSSSCASRSLHRDSAFGSHSQLISGRKTSGIKLIGLTIASSQLVRSEGSSDDASEFEDEGVETLEGPANDRDSFFQPRASSMGQRPNSLRFKLPPPLPEMVIKSTIPSDTIRKMASGSSVSHLHLRKSQKKRINSSAQKTTVSSRRIAGIGTTIKPFSRRKSSSNNINCIGTPTHSSKCVALSDSIEDHRDDNSDDDWAIEIVPTMPRVGNFKAPVTVIQPDSRNPSIGLSLVGLQPSAQQPSTLTSTDKGAGAGLQLKSLSLSLNSQPISSTSTPKSQKGNTIPPTPLAISALNLSRILKFDGQDDYYSDSPRLSVVTNVSHLTSRSRLSEVLSETYSWSSKRGSSRQSIFTPDHLTPNSSAGRLVLLSQNALTDSHKPRRSVSSLSEMLGVRVVMPTQDQEIPMMSPLSEDTRRSMISLATASGSIGTQRSASMSDITTTSSGARTGTFGIDTYRSQPSPHSSCSSVPPTARSSAKLVAVSEM